MWDPVGEGGCPQIIPVKTRRRWMELGGGKKCESSHISATEHTFTYWNTILSKLNLLPSRRSIIFKEYFYWTLQRNYTIRSQRTWLMLKIFCIIWPKLDAYMRTLFWARFFNSTLPHGPVRIIHFSANKCRMRHSGSNKVQLLGKNTKWFAVLKVITFNISVILATFPLWLTAKIKMRSAEWTFVQCQKQLNKKSEFTSLNFPSCI